jgi:hypothetical protein
MTRTLTDRRINEGAKFYPHHESSPRCGTRPGRNS